jgi:hypothetical protein
VRDIVQTQANALEIALIALHKLNVPVPGTKGLGPKDRAQRLHAEFERRIAIASEALKAISYV